MTISTENRKAGPFTGNNLATEFDFEFKIFASSDLYVVRRNDDNTESILVEGADYSVEFSADTQDDEPGGSITYPIDVDDPKLQSDERLVILSDLEELQQTDLENGGDFNANIHEDRFDYITILIQQLHEQLSRTLQIPVTSDSDVSTFLPLPEPYALLGWNSTGTAIVNYTLNDLAALLGGAGGGGGGGGGEGSGVFNNPVTFNNTVVFNDETTFNDIAHFTVPPDLPPNSIGLDVLKDEVIGALIDPLAFSFNGESEALSTEHSFTVHLFDCTILAARAGCGVVSSSGDVDFDLGRDGGNSLFTEQATLPQGDDLVDLTSILDPDEVQVTNYEKFSGTISAAGTGVTGFKIYLDVIHGGTFSVLPAEPPTTTVDAFKVGDMKMTHSMSPDAGWLLCNGAAVSRTVYPRLFEKIGTTWGAGNGTTTFNIPNMLGRSPLGAGNGAGLTPRAVGDSLGTESEQLTAAQSGLVGHSHTAAGGSAGSIQVFESGAEESGPRDRVQSAWDDGSATVGTAAIDGGSVSVTVNAVGSSSAASPHNNMHPSAVVAFWVKV